LKPSISLPQWLEAEQKYNPIADKDAFLDKSILSMIGVVSRIRAQSARGEGVFRPHALFRLVAVLLLIVLLALSRSFSFVAVAVVALLCRVSLLPARDIARILRKSLVAALFAALILLPAALLGSPYSLWMITPKVFACVTAASLLSLLTRWEELTSALKFLFVPDLFIFVLDIAVKYILLLGEFALNMLHALKLRSVGRNTSKRTRLAGVAGLMFIKSREMAAEMHQAMECRGFSGEYRRLERFRVNWSDVILLAAAAALVMLYIYLGG
jgi:cobalt/nickel transport system permease protein